MGDVRYGAMPYPGRWRVANGRIVDPSQGIDEVGDLLIEGSRIVGVAKPGEAGGPCFDASGLVVCPGFVDIHCHLREPGQEHKETIATGSRAAAAGGFTTICCMPNTRPVLDNAGQIEFVLETAARDALVRVLPIGAVTVGQSGKELAELGEMAEAGAVAFSDDGRPVATSRLMRHALEYARSLARPVVEHCEDLDLAAGGSMHEGLVSTLLGLKGIPAAAEEIVVARDIALARLTGGRLHLAHVSTAGSVALIRRAKEEGLRVTAEVTPHHLTLTDAWVVGPPGWEGPPLYDTRAKVNPPLRTEADIEALLEGLVDGTIDCIATDHAPHSSLDKECEFALAAFGISVFETALGSLMGLVDAGRLRLPDLVRWLTVEPARVFGLPYGTLKADGPADVVVFDPQREWVVDPERFHSKGKNTPLAGQRLRGKVVLTLAEGRVAHLEDGARWREQGAADAR